MLRASNSTLSSVCTVCFCVKACTHLSLSVYSILHARLHSSQPVCRHRNTGQLSEYPPADTGTPPTSLILLTSSRSPCPLPLSFLPFSLITCCTHACPVLCLNESTANAGIFGFKGTSMLFRAKAMIQRQYSDNGSTLSVIQPMAPVMINRMNTGNILLL